MKNIFFVLIVITGFYSCEGFNEFFQDNEYYNLPDENKTSLTIGDTIVFKNENSLMDSFWVQTIEKGNNKLPLSGTATKEPYAFHEYEKIKIYNLHDSYGINQPFIGIEVGIRNLPATTYDGVPKDYLPSISWLNQTNFEFVSAHNTIIINNILYKNVQEFSSALKIKNLFYDYKYGIIKYTDSDDHTWTKIR